ncbi:zinc finger protein 142 [Protopterus annectens]|uniref:zinc finger protein 142 n=1 Tax=Protopterus annectens TaxID=7888 RepID=UPI001CFBF82D|nr:zinc finger protein 142 [Protopterus annectens]
MEGTKDESFDNNKDGSSRGRYAKWRRKKVKKNGASGHTENKTLEDEAGTYPSTSDEDGHSAAQGPGKEVCRRDRPCRPRYFRGDVEEGKEHLFKTHMCPECKRCFKKRTHLVEHLHLHFPDPSLQCPNCQKFFTSKSKLKIHLMREMGEKAHHCPLCDYSSVEKNALNRHMASMHENISNFYSDVYICPVCEERFKLSQALKEHMKTHKDESKALLCFLDTCDFTTEDRKEFIKHAKEFHDIKVVECRYHACSILFRTREEMEAHRKVHYAFHCDQCDFVCSNKHVFRKHKRQGHAGKDELTCAFCPYKTFNPVEYSDHVGKMHANEKIHKCTECSFATAHKRVLNRHTLLHTGEKPHKCTLCAFTCRDVSYLSKHMLTHSDDKNYMCTECGYVTKWKHYLNVHMRKHTGDLRYQCNQCSYRCHRVDQLTSHKLRHQAKSLICEVCGFACKRKYELQKHTQMKHSQDYQMPTFQCQYCTYQTKYKQALLNHENCKHTKQKEFRCALCSYRTFSNTSLFFHKRKIHGYVPGNKEWLDNYANKELASNASDIVLEYNHINSTQKPSENAPTSEKVEVPKNKSLTIECPDEMCSQVFDTSNFQDCPAQMEPNEGAETTEKVLEELNQIKGGGDEKSCSQATIDTTCGETDGIQEATVNCGLPFEDGFSTHLDLHNTTSDQLTKDVSVPRNGVVESWNYPESGIAFSQLESNEGLVIQEHPPSFESHILKKKSTDKSNSEQCNVIEIIADKGKSNSSSDEILGIGQDHIYLSESVCSSEVVSADQDDADKDGNMWISVLQPSILSGSDQSILVPNESDFIHLSVIQDNTDQPDEEEDSSLLQSESVMRALRRQDKEQAETLVSEGRVQMLVVQSETHVYKCEKCAYITRKEKSMQLHSRSGCQGKKSPLVCKECGASFKQQRGLNTHILKKCPVILKKSRVLSKLAYNVQCSSSKDEHQITLDSAVVIPGNDGLFSGSSHEDQSTFDGCVINQACTDMEIPVDITSILQQKCSEIKSEIQHDFQAVAAECPVNVDVELLAETTPSGSFPVKNISELETLQVSDIDILDGSESNTFAKADKYILEQGKFHCNFCTFVCSRQSTILCHVEEGCRKMEHFECNICTMTFQSKRILRKHQIKKHSELGADKLDAEEEECFTDSEEEGNLVESTSEGVASDEDWGKSADIGGLFELDGTHKERNLSCPSCPFTCSQSRAMKTHKKMGCMKPGEFQCSLCSFICKSFKALSHHKQLHQSVCSKKPQLTCELCNFTCKQARCLKQHISIKHEGIKPYKCSYCDFSTTRRYRLEAHESLHTGMGRITCDICSQTFGTNSKLRIHKLRVHEKKPTHFCMLCDYSGYNQNDITRHMNSCHNGELQFACNQCDSKFSSETALKQHVLRKHEQKVCYCCLHCSFTCYSEATLKCHMQKQHPHLICGICKEKFNTREELEEHRKAHFNYRCECCDFAAKERQQLVQHLMESHETTLENEKQLTCPFCNFSCHHQLVYDYHVKGHGGTRVYKCTDCDYMTKNKQKITWHIRIHTGEKPYKCHLCNYACADPSRLKYHMRIHQEERKYLCPECGYKCKWVNQLKYHMTKHTGIKPYQCDECEYCTNRADALRIHKETRHKEARSFICEQCGKAFKTRFLLKTHLKKHSEDKPYVCNVCFRGFRWAAGLRHHYLTHTNEHPFFCRYCTYKAKQKFQVIKHIQRHHSQNMTDDPNQGVGKDPSAPVVHLQDVKLGTAEETPAS